MPRRVLVGYSGGADSLGLLTLLSSLAPAAGFRVSAMHVDHGVRSQSGADAELAANVCRVLGVDLVLKRIHPDSIAGHAGVGREEALRRERYRCFAAALAETGADVVALAHHQRDQAETVVLHLLRGAGLNGASGMRSLSEVAVPWWEDPEPVQMIRVWRPLLAVPLDNLRSYALGTGLPIADDASNLDESFRRNAIRHTALPVLEQIAPGATANLARFASLAAVDADALDAEADAAMATVLSGDEIVRNSLLALPLAIRSRVLRRWVSQHAPAGLEISLERVESVLAVAASPGGTRLVEIGRGLSVEVSRDRLRVVAQPLT